MSAPDKHQENPDGSHEVPPEQGPQLEQFREDALVHLPSLYGAALRMTQRPSAAEDLVQDTLMKAW